MDWVADPLLERSRRTAETLAWLAGAVLGDDFRPRADPLTQLRGVVPALLPAVCESVTAWVVEQGQLVCQAAGIGNDLQLDSEMPDRRARIGLYGRESIIDRPDMSQIAESFTELRRLAGGML